MAKIIKHLNKSFKESTENKNYISNINQELYKRNVELAFRNKTLSLLRKLYTITLANLELKKLGQVIVNTIRDELNLTMVGLFVLSYRKKVLKPLAFSFSDRLNLALKSMKSSLNLTSLTVNLSKEKNLYQKALNQKKVQKTEFFSDLWSKDVLKKEFASVQAETKLKSSLIYPLITKQKFLGALVISLDRSYKEISDFESETFDSFVDVIAVALDKSLIYEQLRIANRKQAEMNIELKELLNMKSEFLTVASY